MNKIHTVFKESQAFVFALIAMEIFILIFPLILVIMKDIARTIQRKFGLNKPSNSLRGSCGNG